MSLTLISALFPVALDQARFKVGGYCQVCKMAITYVDELLEKNATEAQIEEAVRKACSFLPDSLQTEVRSCILSLCNFYLSSWQPRINYHVSCPQCDQLVEQYEPVLVQLLLQMLDPDFVCMVNQINSQLNYKMSNVNTLIYHTYLYPSPFLINWSHSWCYGFILYFSHVLYWTICSFRKWEPAPRLNAGCWEQSSAAGDLHSGARTWRQQLGAMWVAKGTFWLPNSVNPGLVFGLQTHF